VLAVTEHHLARPDTPVVVLTHGAMDRSQSFRRVVGCLSDLRVITYDRRGYGGSVRDGPPSGLEEHTSDLLRVIGNRRATVVAHSVGGHIAVLAAIRDPDHIAGIALWEPSVPWMDLWPERARQSIIRISSAPNPGAALVGRKAWNRLSDAAQEQSRAEEAAFLLDIAPATEAPYDWADLRVPCLIGYGASWPHIETSPQLAAAVGCSTFTIDGASHAAHRSHPGEFAQFARRAAALSDRDLGAPSNWFIRD
jgi:pimeloyl-ACP methyl ester carboxylesterase